MKEYQVDVIINDDFDNPITIHTIEAINEKQAEDKAIALCYEQRDDCDIDCDLVDVIAIRKV